MKTKEAIEFLEVHKLCMCYNQKTTEEINKIIILLKEIEKENQILEGFKNELVYEADFEYGHRAYKRFNIGYLFDKFKQKNFPELKPRKPEKWERFICVDFPSGASFIVKMTVTKDKEGITMIRYEPAENYSDTLEKGGE